jgi:hypothetical protein
MNTDELDDDFEPDWADVSEVEKRALEDAQARQREKVMPGPGITAGQYKGMVVLPRSSASPLLRLMHAEPLPFGGYVGSYNGQDVELHHLDIPTSVCERFWPDVTDFLYGPEEMLDAALREIGIEPASLPADFMDPFERGLARYAIYGT